MDATQNTFQDIEQQVLNTVTVVKSKVYTASADLASIRDALHAGFRLPEEDRE